MPDHEDYEELMGNSSLGYFLFHPKVASVVKPGTCGYIDGNGHFHVIEFPGQDQEMKTDQVQNWEPVIQQCSFKATQMTEANIEFPGLPAGAGFKFDFTSKKEEASVLLTASVRQRYIDDLGALKSWVKNNSERLLSEKSSELKTHGLWVIDRTYMSPKCSIAFWRGKGNTVSFGVSATAYSAGKLTTSGNWQRVTSGGSWRTIPDIPTEGCSRISDDECHVFSIMGYHYTYSPVSAALGKTALRSGDDFQFSFGGEEYLAESESWTKN